MSHWIIDPIDPLVFGDGRPFSAIPGGVLRSRPLPPPTAVAGVVRAQLGKNIGKNNGLFDPAQIPTLLQVAVHGPLVALLNDRGDVVEWLAPRPLDAVLHQPKDAKNGPELRCLRPIEWPKGSQGSQKDTLAPLDWGGPEPLGKPPRELRPFWRLKTELIPWLMDPSALQFSEDLGVCGPQPDRRVHVSIDPTTGTAKHGALFSVEGRAWIIQHEGKVRRLAFGVAVEGDKSPKQSLHPLGGERRLAAWRAHGGKHQDALWPTLPDELRKKIVESKGLRILLATPAEFENGALPRQDAPFRLVGAKLVAVANDRAEVISGWDLQSRGPKPTRRLVPAGAVYFLDTSAVARDALNTWLDDTWLRPVSDAEDARRDGLGLALLGAWDGTLSTLTP